MAGMSVVPFWGMALLSPTRDTPRDGCKERGARESCVLGKTSHFDHRWRVTWRLRLMTLRTTSEALTNVV